MLAMPGEFLEVASAGAFQASVHRVRGGSEKRVSTPLLVRADLREPWDGLEASSVWRALQKCTGSEALKELLSLYQFEEALRRARPHARGGAIFLWHAVPWQ